MDDAARGPADRQEARERLILSSLPLVNQIAGRLAAGLPADVSRDDLYGWGVLGLLSAVDRYDAGRGVKFETYAALRIRGAILDGLRSLDWLPRSVRRRVRELERGRGRAEARLGRPALEAEMAAELGLSLAEIRSRLGEAYAAASPGLPNQGAAGETLPDPDSDPLAAIIARETAGELARAMAALPDRERLVINMYYGGRQRLKDVARTLGISPSRASQLHARALRYLRRALRKR